MDLTDTIVPKSDQLNAEDLLTGPRTFTITEVRSGSVEQPVDIHLAEFPGRPFKPSKTVRRILVAAWGPDANTYAGHRMTLYRDPAVKFGGMDVGGIRVSHLSHIKKPMTLALAVTRGKRAAYVVQPLAERAPEPTTVHTDSARGDGITAAQTKALFDALRDNDLDDRDAGLAYISDVIGREITTSKDLTRAEAQKVIDSLDVPPAPDVAPIPGTETP